MIGHSSSWAQKSPKPFRQVIGCRACVFLLSMLTCGSPLLLGQTIDEAVKNDNAVEVRALIQANPGLVFTRDENGFTPLHLAAANGHEDLVEYLLTTRAEVNSKDNAGSTPLHQAAAEKGHSDIAKLLLRHGANVNAQDKHGLTPLHYAVLADNLNIAKLLLDHGANVDAQDAGVFDTALILAVARGNKDLVELLLAKKADVNLADNKGTPTAWAIHTNHTDLANLLRKHGGHE